MSSIKISDLIAKATMDGTEEILINDSGTSKKMTTQPILDAQSAAETAETNAETAQTAAETAQTAAETAETNASTSASAASTSASNASTSATAAASSASTASTKASEASTSATNAATSETNAATSETNAATSESNASTSATAAASSATSAAGSATTATTKASEASTSASNASTSETNAATSETNASNSATSAASSATSAASAQSAAESARDATLTAYDNFDDRYLGTKSSDPTLDNDSNALVAGALYFNTTDEEMKVYTGSAWVAAYVSGSGVLLIANNLSDLNNDATARTNLGVAIGTDVQAYSSVLQNTTASFTTTLKTKLDGIETAADVTDTANVTSAGALMDSEVTNLAQVKAFNSADYATAAQGTKADSALQSSDIGTSIQAYSSVLAGTTASFTTADETKLDGIESGATADQTGAEIKTAYEGEANTNAFTDAEKTKLSGIETGATADQSAAEIKTAYESNANTNAFTDAEKTKLSGIETGADVTDATNVNAAGAVMNTDTTTASMSFVVDEDTMTSNSATKVPTQQSVKAYVDSQVQSKDALSELSGTLDDITDGTTYKKFSATEQTKLSGIETGATADQTASEILTLIKTVDGGGSGLNADLLDGVSSGSFLRSNIADTKTSGDLSFSDNVKATFGAGNDLKIYHDGSNSKIVDSGTGSLYIDASSSINFRSGDGGETLATFNDDGACNLRHNNSVKIATTSTGIDVTGTVTTDTARSPDVVDNDGSFNLNAGTNFTCTPTGNITLTFTNIPDGQSGTIVLKNTGGHTISAHTNTKVMGADMLTTITTAGTYVIGYISDGTNVRVYNSLAQQ